MSVKLDHTIVCRNQARPRSASRAARRALGRGGAWPFSPVYVNDGLTLDFIDDDTAFPIQHSASA